MINYAIPGLYTHFPLIQRLIKLLHTELLIFYPNINIEAVYGLFPFCIWDGGRTFVSMLHASFEEIEEEVKFYLTNNIRLRLILTNNLLKSEHYMDHFGNLILDICNIPNNLIVCSDDNFKTYILLKYTNYEFISSTTKCLNKNLFLHELKKDDYSEICLDYNLNTNLDLLRNLSPEEKNKCEFLVNAICPPGCQYRKKHYTLNSLHYLNLGQTYKIPECGITLTNIYPEILKQQNNLIYEDIRDIYEPLGFLHFKLEGRTFDDITWASNIALYFIKPEYHLYFISALLN